MSGHAGNVPWDDLAFERVFVTESDALMWQAHHQEIGSPGQPFHYQPYQTRLRSRAKALVSDRADFLGALKLLVQIAKAEGDLDTALSLGRSDATCSVTALTSSSLLLAC